MSTETKEIYLDRDHTYLEADDGVLFCVAGDSHSEDFVYGMPYYVATDRLEGMLGRPVEESIDVRGNQYSKILANVALQQYPEFVREYLPEYHYSPDGWKVLMRMAREKVDYVHDPVSFATEVFDRDKLASDEDSSLLYALGALHRRAPQLIGRVGITGSLLLTRGINDRIRNDVDLIFYGEKSVDDARDFSEHILRSNSRFSGLSDVQLDAYIRQKKERFGDAVSENQLRKTVEGRFDTIFVDGTKLDFTFSRTTPEADGIAWDTLEPKETLSIRGTVVDASGSYYLPTRLTIDNKEYGEIIITARGYICLFNEGDSIHVDGQVFESKKDGSRYVVVDENKGFVVLRS